MSSTTGCLEGSNGKFLVKKMMDRHSLKLLLQEVKAFFHPAKHMDSIYLCISSVDCCHACQ